MINDTVLLEALPVAVYTVDAEGFITFFNEPAARLWGRRPELGIDRWCGALRLFSPDGRPMRHEESPLATTLRQGEAVVDIEVVAERPEGTLVLFTPSPTLLRDTNGQITGAIILLIDLSERNTEQVQLSRLAAIVSSSDDAILSKTLQGRITSWNAGATRIFGYTAEEVIGQPITRIIPLELHDEEAEILAKLRRGERIDHFDTVRVGKDGRRIDISVTVSPIRDGTGTIVGASKVARDITERKQSDALQRLLFDELNHRVKNTLATVQALASQSLRVAPSPAAFVDSFNGRVQALARAHDLLVQGKMQGADVMQIVHEQVAFGSSDGTRIHCSGPALTLEPRAAVQLALVLHELSTNARKYGALSVPTGQLSITWQVRADPTPELLLEWRESGVPNVRKPTSRGFGTILIERSLSADSNDATIRYEPGGIACTISLSLSELKAGLATAAELAANDQAPIAPPPEAPSVLHGKRILVIEDEPLVAMDIEFLLGAAGCKLVGPAGTVDVARRLIQDGNFDAALLDANLAGHPVHELALALRQARIPFAFATGYGREALPFGFNEVPVITKPFSSTQLLEELEHLLERSDDPAVEPPRETVAAIL